MSDKNHGALYYLLFNSGASHSYHNVFVVSMFRPILVAYCLIVDEKFDKTKSLPKYREEIVDLF